MSLLLLLFINRVENTSHQYHYSMNLDLFFFCAFFITWFKIDWSFVFRFWKKFMKKKKKSRNKMKSNVNVFFMENSKIQNKNYLCLFIQFISIALHTNSVGCKMNRRKKQDLFSIHIGSIRVCVCEFFPTEFRRTYFLWWEVQWYQYV